MNSYLRKIEAERIVLRIVNERFADQLHGLSAGAISSWAGRVKVPAALLADLTDVGQSVGAMCERSGERIQDPHRQRMERARRAVLAFRSRYGSA